jgi:hypothetical protein
MAERFRAAIVGIVRRVISKWPACERPCLNSASKGRGLSPSYVVDLFATPATSEATLIGGAVFRLSSPADIIRAAEPGAARRLCKGAGVSRLVAR